jgi:hypothetical protein
VKNTDRYDVTYKELKSYLKTSILKSGNYTCLDEDILDKIIKDFLSVISDYDLNKHNNVTPFADFSDKEVTDETTVQFFMPNLNKNIVINDFVWKLMPDMIDVYCDMANLPEEQKAIISLYKFIDLSLSILKSNKNPVNFEYCIFSLAFRKGFGSNLPGHSKPFTSDHVIKWLPEYGKGCRVTTQHCECEYRCVENLTPICNFPTEDRNTKIYDILKNMTYKNLLANNEDNFTTRW